MLRADHIPDIFKFPVSDKPIPYTELLITANPGYKKGAKPSDGVHKPAQPPLEAISGHSAVKR